METDTATGLSLLTIFGLVAAGLMLLTYALEEISDWFILAFAAACVVGAVYGFLLTSGWPFGLLEFDLGGGGLLALAAPPPQGQAGFVTTCNKECIGAHAAPVAPCAHIAPGRAAPDF